jgi:hypothetical protein
MPIYEHGTEGIIRIMRDGDTTNPLEVQVTVGGTATSDEDYELIQPPITIPGGESSVDVEVIPIWNEIADTGSRTVSITIEPGMEDYDPGTSATISIRDDVDTLTRVIHEESFQLSGTSGYVNASLSVTFTSGTALTDPGTYTWVYQLQNPSAPTGTTTWTTFRVPVEASRDIDDVDNLQGARPAGAERSITMGITSSGRQSPVALPQATWRRSPSRRNRVRSAQRPSRWTTGQMWPNCPPRQHPDRWYSTSRWFLSGSRRERMPTP